MEQVILKPLFHKEKENIGIYFPKGQTLQSLIQKEAGARWSRTCQCWYVALSEENYRKIAAAVRGKAVLNVTDLKEYLITRKNRSAGAAVSAVELPAIPNSGQDMRKPNKTATALSPENSEALQKFRQMLTLKGYSPSTIRTYTNELTPFLNTLQKVPARSLTAERLKDYLEYCHKELKLAENTLHSRVNAMKFFYEKVLGYEKFFWDIPRPKKPLLLPKVLNETELRRIFNSLRNKKHKAMLFTAYSAGLRVSEVVRLKLSDIDSKRMQIFVERAKDKKDRYVNLSPILLDILRSYLSDCSPKPRHYLFESEQTRTAFPVRTVQQIFSNAKSKAGIKKEVGIHSLRHSFATHLLEKGTDIKYIKELLGHFNIKTTERYLHVSNEKLVNIVSPFDDLWKQEKLDW